MEWKCHFRFLFDNSNVISPLSLSYLQQPGLSDIQHLILSLYKK
jgi:hypothetical protein